MIHIQRNGKVILDGEPAQIIRVLIEGLKSADKGDLIQADISDWRFALSTALTEDIQKKQITDVSTTNPYYIWEGEEILYRKKRG